MPKDAAARRSHAKEVLRLSEKLFRKDIEPSCSYCAHGADIGADTVICIKKGPVPADGACKKFQYDPFRRRPPEPKKLDFSAPDGGFSL